MSARITPPRAVASVSLGRVALAGGVAGALWLVSGGLLQALRWFTPYASVAGAVMPETMPGAMWIWPGVSGVLTALLGALAVAAMTVALSVWFRRTTDAGRLGSWLAVVLAAVIVGAATDLFRLAAIPAGLGLRSALSITGLGTFAAAGAYWGALYGWIVALVSPRRPRAGTASGGSGGDSGSGGRGGAVGAGLSRRVLRLVAIAAVLITVAYAVAGAVGQRAADQQQQAEAIAAEDAAAEAAGTPRTGAARDPSAQGEPVAPRDDAAGPRDAAWCSAEDSTLMFGDPDAATGHRMIALRMVNGADKPCVLNGYPDILFADQNGHQLDVTVEHGGSFMVQDPGAAPITIEPGAWAVSYIGWNANSTHGELVATEVYSAMVPGDERHPWPPQAPFDIIPGSTVAVTAWAPDEGPQPAD